MLFTLPPIDKEPIPLSHFPTRHQAFIFRASEYVPAEKIASVLRTTAENVQRAAEDMGIPHFNPENKWLKRGYITIIRRMWHILPYEQLFELLDTDKEAFARLLLYEAGYPRVTHPSATQSFLLPSVNFHKNASFDLHVLGTPPAFILSQDQTLMFIFSLGEVLSNLVKKRSFNLFERLPQSVLRT